MSKTSGIKKETNVAAKKKPALYFSFSSQKKNGFKNAKQKKKEIDRKRFNTATNCFIFLS